MPISKQFANAGNLIQFVISNIASISDLFIVLLQRLSEIFRNESHSLVLTLPLIRRLRKKRNKDNKKYKIVEMITSYLFKNVLITSFFYNLVNNLIFPPHFF